MTAFIHCIETAVPAHAYPQDFAREKMQTWLPDEKYRRIANRVYRNSGIDTRYSVLDDFTAEPVNPLFRIGPDGRLIEPSTKARNDRFATEAHALAVEVARRALRGCHDIDERDITHVITTTCTGFSNPGPDYHIVRDLHLRPETQRYALGFMGCYAALPALRMADQFCRADPCSVVLVVSVELCSLHLHIGDGPDSLLGNTVFADGAAAAIVTGSEPSSRRTWLQLDGFASSLIPSAENDMAWSIGNQGFEIALSSYVPDIIGANVESLIDPALKANGLSKEDIASWAVHPGGRAIVDKVQNALHLRPEQVQASRDVLRKFGNMSSATSLFVLRELLEGPTPSEASSRICAIAFGPGLTVEAAFLRTCGRNSLAADAGSPRGFEGGKDLTAGRRERTSVEGERTSTPPLA